MTQFDNDVLARGPARWSYRMKVRFQDIDAAGIIFYPKFFEYFHDAWVAYLDDRGWELHRVLRERRFAAPLRHVEADYLRPLRFGDPIDVGIFGVNIEGSDMNIGYRVARPEGELVATGQTLHVCVDPVAFRRLRAVPDDIHAAIAPLIVEERGAP